MKAKQLVVAEDYLIALAENGSVWSFIPERGNLDGTVRSGMRWERLPDLPDEEPSGDAC